MQEVVNEINKMKRASSHSFMALWGELLPALR